MIAAALLMLSLATAAPELSVHTIENFESEAALRAWTCVDVKAAYSTRHATRGDWAACLVYPRWQAHMCKWPAVSLDHGKRGFTVTDWSRYDRLRFDVHNASDKQATLRLKLQDATRAAVWKVLNVPAGGSLACDVPIASLSIDTTRVAQFNLYMTEPATDFEIFLDNIRLEAGRLRVEAAALVPDPSGSGAVGVEARASRAAAWELRITDATGTVAVLHKETGSRFRWRWDGRTPKGRAPAGQYKAVLAVTDTMRNMPSPPVTDLGGFEILVPRQRADIIAWYEPTTRKVMLHDHPAPGQPFASWDADGEPKKAPVAQFDMCRNEYAGMQVVWRTRERGATFHFAVEDLRHAGSGTAFPMARSALYQVGYVQTKDPKKYGVKHVGWWPDPLLPTKAMLAEPGECMPLWISLKSTADTQPGAYKGRISVWVDGKRRGHLPLEVRVHDAVLPDTTTVRTAFSLNRVRLASPYRGYLTPDMWQRYQEFVADHRINPDSLYRSAPPPLEDVAAFAKRGQLNAFNLMYLPPGQDADSYGEKRLERIAALLDPCVAELRKRGLADKAYIYGFDEAGPDQHATMRRVFGFLKKRYPDIATMTTAHDPSFGADSGLADVVDIWVPLTARYDREPVAAARKRGKDVWWYVCRDPHNPFANWFVEYTALEPRLLWWMTYRRGIQGFLYYNMNRWPNQKKPLRVNGRNKTNWDPASYETYNGDGSLFCAGPDGPITTIRFENIRDGIEDHELLCLLAKRLADGGKESRKLCDALAPSLTEFTRDPDAFAKVRLRLLKRLSGGGE